MSPNSGFWVVPAAAAFAGSAGTMIAVLANVITSVWGGVCVHLMRRDAPLRQRRATSWVDQSPVLASVVGLLLHVVGPAPGWTEDVLTLAAPAPGLLGRGALHRVGHPPAQHLGPPAATRDPALGLADRDPGRVLPRRHRGGGRDRVDRAGRRGRAHAR